MMTWSNCVKLAELSLLTMSRTCIYTYHFYASSDNGYVYAKFSFMYAYSFVSISDSRSIRALSSRTARKDSNNFCGCWTFDYLLKIVRNYSVNHIFDKASGFNWQFHNEYYTISVWIMWLRMELRVFLALRLVWSARAKVINRNGYLHIWLNRLIISYWCDVLSYKMNIFRIFTTNIINMIYLYMI